MTDNAARFSSPAGDAGAGQASNGRLWPARRILLLGFEQTLRSALLFSAAPVQRDVLDGAVGRIAFERAGEIEDGLVGKTHAPGRLRTQQVISRHWLRAAAQAIRISESGSVIAPLQMLGREQGQSLEMAIRIGEQGVSVQ